MDTKEEFEEMTENENNLPLISFVVLTFNNKNSITNCLDSIVNQEYPCFELIVVDDDSTDGTLEIIKKYMRGNQNLRLLRSGEHNIGKSRRIGVAESKGEICALIDSDCELPREQWAKTMVRPFLGDEKVAGTWTLGAYKKNYPSIARYSILSNPYRQTKLPPVIDRENYWPVGTGHILLKKKAILEVGGFRDLKAGEDVDLTQRIIERGYKLVYVNGCEVYHLHAPNLKQFLKKYKRDVKSTLSYGPKTLRGVSSGNSMKFLFSNLLIYPIYASVRGFRKDRDIAWFWHPAICLAKYFIVAKSILELKT